MKTFKTRYRELLVVFNGHSGVKWKELKSVVDAPGPNGRVVAYVATEEDAKMIADALTIYHTFRAVQVEEKPQ